MSVEAFCFCRRGFWPDAGALLCPRCTAAGAVDALAIFELEIDSEHVQTFVEITPLTRSPAAASRFLVRHGPRKLGYVQGSGFDAELLKWARTWRKPGRVPFSDPGAWQPARADEPWARAFWVARTFEAWLADVDEVCS